MTQYEKIKAMSIEKMATFLAHIVFDGVNLVLDDKGLPIMEEQTLHRIVNTYKIYLAREAEEDG